MTKRSKAERPRSGGPLRCSALALALWCGATGAAQAQALADQGLGQRVDELTRLVDRQQHEIQSLERQMLDLQMAQRGRGIANADTTNVAAAPPAPADAASPPHDAAAGGTTTAAAAPQAIGTEQQAATPPRTQSEQAAVQKEHAPLFDHKLTVDSGFTYTYYDRRQLSLTGFLALDAIFLGSINLNQTKSSQYMFDVDTRYGLTDRISVDVDVPYVYRSSQFIAGGAGGAANTMSDLSINSTNVGDVNVGMYYQFVKESNAWPDLVGSLRVKSHTGSSPFGIKLFAPSSDNNNLIVPGRLPTGTGFWNVTAGVSALKTYDPVVLFGSLAYTYNLSRSFSDISTVQGQVEPATVKLGDVYQLGAGVAVALSDKTSTSLSVTSAFEAATKTAAPGAGYAKVPGSETNATTLNFGLNQVVSKHLTVNGAVSIGLTPDAPNFVVGLRLPYTF